MNKPLIGAFLAALLLGAGVAPAVAAESAQVRESATEVAPAPAAKAVTFAGTVALSNCSGSVVRSPDSAPTDPALVLSNGHCLETGFPGPGEVLVDRPSTRTFTLLDASGSGVGTLRASKIAYGTMTDTDLSLYELTSTYEEIESASGTYSCDIDGFVHQLKEGRWTWKDSVRYTPECQTIGGTSGSPVIDDATGKVVAVNNTGNESGQECTDNNPCEVDENGSVTVREGINYAQQTYNMVPCIGVGNKIDLDREGCGLPKP